MDSECVQKVIREANEAARAEVMTPEEQKELNHLAEMVAKLVLLTHAVQVSEHPTAISLRTACYRILEIKTAKQVQHHLDAAQVLMAAARKEATDGPSR